MRQSQPCEQRLRQLIGTDLSADEVERLASVDALLRVAAACDRDDAVPTSGFTERRRDDQTHELKLTFGQLALVYMHSGTDKPRTRLLPSEEDRHDTNNDKA